MKKVLAVAGVMLAATTFWSGNNVKAEQAAVAPAAPTFTKDIAPIFYANCTSCH